MIRKGRVLKVCPLRYLGVYIGDYIGNNVWIRVERRGCWGRSWIVGEAAAKPKPFIDIANLGGPFKTLMVLARTGAQRQVRCLCIGKSVGVRQARRGNVGNARPYYLGHVFQGSG